MGYYMGAMPDAMSDQVLAIVDDNSQALCGKNWSVSIELYYVCPYNAHTNPAARPIRVLHVETP